MTGKERKEHMNKEDGKASGTSGETRSGNPNPVDPNKVRSTEHKSGYGGEGGKPRTSSDKREKPGSS